MGKTASLWAYSYEKIADLTGLSLNSLYQYKKRGELDPADLESVFLFLARHAQPDLRRRMIDYALDRRLPDRPGRKKRASGGDD